MGKDKEQIAFRVTPQMKREIDLISNKYKALRKEVKTWKNNSEPTMTSP